MEKFLTFLLLTFMLTFSLLSAPVNACSRILLVNPGHPVLVGNNMDWFEDMNTHLFVYPRGIKRTGIVSNPMTWESKYGSLVVSAYENISTNGINERGLAVHLLGLKDSHYGNRDEKVPALFITMWAQFYLDNFQSVAEAVTFTQSHDFQIVSYVDPRINKKLGLHLVMEDVSGDSAIIEYTDGRPHIYHDKQYIVATNEPYYDAQLDNLKQYISFGGDKPLPGTTLPKDRFVRAAYYALHLPEPSSDETNLYNLMSILENVAQPAGSHTPERTEEGFIFNTRWHSVTDLTNLRFYFRSTRRFSTFWTSLSHFNLQAGSKVMELNLEDHPNLQGDVTNEFMPYSSR